MQPIFQKTKCHLGNHWPYVDLKGNCIDFVVQMNYTLPKIICLYANSVANEYVWVFATLNINSHGLPAGSQWNRTNCMFWKMMAFTLTHQLKNRIIQNATRRKTPQLPALMHTFAKLFEHRETLQFYFLLKKNNHAV